MIQGIDMDYSNLPHNNTVDSINDRFATLINKDQDKILERAPVSRENEVIFRYENKEMQGKSAMQM